MTNEERAQHLAALFTHYDATGANWRHNVPLDVTVKRNTVYFGGGVRLVRHRGKWAVRSGS